MALAGQGMLTEEQAERFNLYLSLILRWNARLNLTAIRDLDGILSRHFVESVVCARALPEGVTTLLDFGSGAGFPGIPIAICRPEIEVTLAESQGKKAAFLNEAVRALNLKVKVHSARAEELRTQFDCVAMRAVDKMGSAVEAGKKLVRENGSLVLMTTAAELDKLKLIAGADFSWDRQEVLPESNERMVAFAIRRSASSL